MIDVSCSVCEDKVVDVGVRKGRKLILEKAIEREDDAQSNCGNEHVWCSEEC